MPGVAVQLAKSGVRNARPPRCGRTRPGHHEAGDPEGKKSSGVEIAWGIGEEFQGSVLSFVRNREI
jgi:hypothetical protein